MFHKHKIFFPIGFLIFALFFVHSCKSDQGREVADVSHIEVDLGVKRFEKDLMTADTNNIHSALVKLDQDYPVFFDCFLTNIMGLPEQDTIIGYAENVRKMISFGGFQAAFDSTMEVYSDIRDIEESLREGFRFFKYHFPERHIPDIVTFVSHYSYGAVTCGDSLIGIGLDLFLGSDYTWYPALQIPNYAVQTMEGRYIPATVMKSYVQHHFDFQEPPGNLLDEMVRNGKQLYFLDLVLPREADHLKMGYTEEQMEWAMRNEGEVWAFLVGEDLLYETSRANYHRFVSDGPNTPGLPPEAAGNMGSWVGWQIVREFIDEYPGIRYEELMEKDSQEILERSGYKPRR